MQAKNNSENEKIQAYRGCGNSAKGKKIESKLELINWRHTTIYELNLGEGNPSYWIYVWRHWWTTFPVAIVITS